MTPDDELFLLLDRMIGVFEDVVADGPTQDQLDAAPTLTDWRPILAHGQPSLHGRTDDHPLLGSRSIVTSMLLHLDEGRRLARTMSRWYRLGPRRDARDRPGGAEDARRRARRAGLEPITNADLQDRLREQLERLRSLCDRLSDDEMSCRLRAVLEAWPATLERSPSGRVQ